MNAELNATIAEAAIMERYDSLGAQGPRNTMEEFSAFLARQVALHARVVRDANIRIE